MNFIFPYFPYIGNVIIPTDFHIFQRGRYTTNQFITYIITIIWIFHYHDVGGQWTVVWALKICTCDWGFQRDEVLVSRGMNWWGWKVMDGYGDPLTRHMNNEGLYIYISYIYIYSICIFYVYSIGYACSQEWQDQLIKVHLEVGPSEQKKKNGHM